MSRGAEALVVSKIKENANGIKYWHKNHYSFSLDYIEEYFNIFQILKANGYILEGEFNDNKWYVTNKKEDIKGTTIIFPFEIHTEINLSLKAFWLICVNERQYDAFNLVGRMRYLQNIIYASNNFSEDKFEEFGDWFKVVTATEDFNGIKTCWKHIRKIAVRYLNFLDIDAKDIYTTLINRILDEKSKMQSRDIPPFKDLITFDELIDDFYELKGKDVEYLQESYKPILIWWKLTSVIPIRIGEFVRLKMDCVDYDKNNKEHYIKIPRIKNKEKIFDDVVMGVEYEIQTLRIHENLAKLIYDFKELNDINEEFLFNYSFFYNHIPTKNKSYVEKYPRIERIIMYSSAFRSLLKRFYKNVIKDIYKEEICYKKYYKLPEDFENKLVALQPGDTRHIAVSNLVELGINPLSIAWYCHHDNIKTQDSYSRYILESADVKAKMLGRKLASMYTRANEINIQTRRIDIIKANMKLDECGFKVEYGVCCATHGIFDCEEIECFFL